MSPVGEFDIFFPGTCEIVFSHIDPAIRHIVNIGEDILIDHHLVAFIGVADGIDRAFSGRSHRRNADVDRINATVRTLREKPLRSTGRRGGTRP